MGNWTTVKIEGSCDPSDLSALREAVNTGDDWEKFHCLCNTGGICGLGDWTGTEIDAVGNLAERGFTTNDIAEQLREMLKTVPSLDVLIHVGGDYEDKACTATVTCRDGEVSIGPAEIDQIPEISESQMGIALMRALMR